MTPSRVMLVWKETTSWSATLDRDLARYIDSAQRKNKHLKLTELAEPSPNAFPRLHGKSVDVLRARAAVLRYSDARSC